jgi:hypothetical protein
LPSAGALNLFPAVESRHAKDPGPRGCCVPGELHILVWTIRGIVAWAIAPFTVWLILRTALFSHIVSEPRLWRLGSAQNCGYSTCYFGGVADKTGSRDLATLVDSDRPALIHVSALLGDRLVAELAARRIRVAVRSEGGGWRAFDEGAAFTKSAPIPLVWRYNEHSWRSAAAVEGQPEDHGDQRSLVSLIFRARIAPPPPEWPDRTSVVPPRCPEVPLWKVWCR